MTPTPGDLIRVKQARGLFRVRDIYRDGSFTSFGPCDEFGVKQQRARWRAFRPSDVTTVEQPKARPE